MSSEELLAAEAVALLEGALRCPTCPGSFPGACCRCRGNIPRRSQLLLVDEVDVLRTGRAPREHLLCDGCLRAQMSDLAQLRGDERSRLSDFEREMLRPVHEQGTGKVGGGL